MKKFCRTLLSGALVLSALLPLTSASAIDDRSPISIAASASTW